MHCSSEVHYGAQCHSALRYPVKVVIVKSFNVDVLRQNARENNWKTTDWVEGTGTLSRRGHTQRARLAALR